MLLGYMNTLTLRPCTQNRATVSAQSVIEQAADAPPVQYQSGTHHGLRGEVGLELGADDAGVTVGADDLAPEAAVVGAAALGLGLVDVGHALPGVPRHVLLGVEPLDLQQGRALVLV